MLVPFAIYVLPRQVSLATAQLSLLVPALRFQVALILERVVLSLNVK